MAQEIAGDSDFSQIKELFVRHKEFLVEHIDPDFGILDKLFANGTLKDREIQDIKILQTFYQRNSKLLELISEQNSYNTFLSVLKDSNQRHVINYLISNGVKKEEFQGEWPLTEKEILTLRINHESLVDLIEPTELVGRLYSSEVLNQRQRKFIDSKQTDYEKNEALLEILKRCSLASYYQAISCLFMQKQDAIATTLMYGGVLARISSIVEGAVNVGEVEAKIVEVIQNLLADKQSADRSRIYELVELSLTGVKIGCSIVLYFRCLRLSELDRIQSEFGSGQLEKKIENVFNHVVTALQVTVTVKIKTTVDDFAGYRNVLSQISLSGNIERKPENKSTSAIKLVVSETTLNDLPANVLDVILEKAFLHWLRSQRGMLSNLASVNYIWSHRFKQRIFKNIIRQQLSEISSTDSKLVYTLKLLHSPSLKFDFEMQDTVSDLNYLKQYLRRQQLKKIIGEDDRESGFESKYTAESILDSVSLSSFKTADETCYRMEYPKRGYCLIFSNINFNKPFPMTRRGVEIDEGKMKRVFTNLGFEVYVYRDLTHVEMVQIASETANLYHGDRDCFVFVIMTYCEDGMLYGVDDQIPLAKLISPFKGPSCSGLFGKPKLFFIQSNEATKTICHGDMLDDISKFPLEADCLYAFSTSGHFSFRNVKTGSWFIHVLAEVLDKYGFQLEIMQLLTRVNRLTMTEFTSQVSQKQFDGVKQIPSVLSMLTRSLYFHPK